jgi:hypothetical protein
MDRSSDQFKQVGAVRARSLAAHQFAVAVAAELPRLAQAISSKDQELRDLHATV